MKTRRLSALFLASSLAVLLAASGSSSASTTASSSPGSSSSASGGVTKLNFVWDFPGPDFGLVPLVAADKLGYFQKEHLSVNVKFPPDTSTTVKELTTGGGQIGFVTTTDMAVAVNAHADVLSIGNYSMKNNWELFSKPGTKISLATLKGKSIFSYGDTWTEAMIPFVLRAAHLSSKQVKVITDPSGNGTTFLLSGRVDVATGTSNYDLASFTGQKGKFYRLLGIDAGCPNIPIWVYATTSSYAKTHATQLREFMTAVSEGTKWAVAHPTQAAHYFDKAYPNTGDSDTYNLVGWKTTIPYLTNASGQYFTQSDAQWTQVAKALKSIKLISSVPTPGTYFTNKYLPSS